MAGVGGGGACRPGWRCPASRVSGQGLGSGGQSWLGCRTAGCGQLALAPRGRRGGGEAGRSRGRGVALRGHWGQAVGVRWGDRPQNQAPPGPFVWLPLRSTYCVPDPALDLTCIVVVSSAPVAQTGEGAGGAGGPLAQGWEDLRLGGRWPQRLAPAAEPRALQMPPFCPAPEGADGGGGRGRGGGCPRRWAGQPPSLTLSRQQMLSAPTGHCGPQRGSPIGRQRPDAGDKRSRTLSAGAARQPGEAHKGAGGGAGNGPGLHMPPLPGRRPSPGEVCRAIVRGTQDVSYTRWPCAV